jgi:hypothetical protein
MHCKPTEISLWPQNEIVYRGLLLAGRFGDRILLKKKFPAPSRRALGGPIQPPTQRVALVCTRISKRCYVTVTLTTFLAQYNCQIKYKLCIISGSTPPPPAQCRSLIVAPDSNSTHARTAVCRCSEEAITKYLTSDARRIGSRHSTWTASDEEAERASY